MIVALNGAWIPACAGMTNRYHNTVHRSNYDNIKRTLVDLRLAGDYICLKNVRKWKFNHFEEAYYQIF